MVTSVMAAPKLDVLGATEPDPIGQILGTGYMRFRSPTGIDGLVKENGDRLDVLAVYSTKPQSGQLRNFIRLAKAIYKTICVWEIMNPVVGEALIRYGFTPEVEIQSSGVVKGYRWDAK